ncbi:MAG: hypothetical protein PUG48_03045 [Clostridia bacterium]|nr:hypothetical protein [Clostridia bacterium]
MKKKTVVLIMSLTLVACLSIGATLAWLTSQTGTLTNTFTIGKIGLTLDEASSYYNIVDDSSIRTTTGNSYFIYNSAVLPKDPTVTIEANSEDCYVFMSYVPTDSLKSVIKSVDVNEDYWTKVEGHEGLYVYSQDGEPVLVKKNSDDQKLEPLFTTVTIQDSCDCSDFTDNEQIVVKALAYQWVSENQYSNAVQAAADSLL